MKYQYRYELSNDSALMQADMLLLKEAYPRLFQKLGGNVHTVSWE